MEKPRPSLNLGKLTSTRDACGRRAATAAGSSCGSRRITSPACSSLSEGGFATTRRSLISVAIDSRLEGFDADTVHHVDEALDFAFSLVHVEAEQLGHHVGHFRPRDRGAEDLADRRAG